MVDGAAHGAMPSIPVIDLSSAGYMAHQARHRNRVGHMSSEERIVCPRHCNYLIKRRIYRFPVGPGCRIGMKKMPD